MLESFKVQQYMESNVLASDNNTLLSLSYKGRNIFFLCYMRRSRGQNARKDVTSDGEHIWCNVIVIILSH